MDNKPDINNALLERLEKVVDSLQDNSVKMGQLLAVHNEKLDKQDRIDEVLFEKIEQVNEKLDRHATDIKKGCERDITLVDNRSGNGDNDKNGNGNGNGNGHSGNGNGGNGNGNGGGNGGGDGGGGGE